MSRTINTIRNARVSLFFGVLVIVLGFFYRKILIDCLGTEVLGLNSTAVNLLGFFNLAEMGIGGAIAFSLYTPLFKKDYNTVDEIVSVQGWLYRRIAYGILAGGMILMCFFPWIFAKIELPLWYAYGSFGVLLLSAFLGYIANYRQIVLSANQQEYKITFNTQGTRILKQLMQIIGIGYFSQGYAYWLAVELTISVIMCVALNKTIRNTFPWLKCNLSQGKSLIRKYPDILKKTKQLFFHKLANYLLNKTAPVLIYAFLSLSVVAIYGNYMLLIASVLMLMDALFNSVHASVGNLVAEGKEDNIMAFFRQYIIVRYWLASVACFCLFYLSPTFITLWLGPQYLLDSTSFLLLIVHAFILFSRANDSFLSAYGLYQDIYAPIVEAVLNLGLSILLGYYWGISGILSGVIISSFVITCCWKPYFLYTKGFKKPISMYVLLIGKILIMITGGWITSWLVFRNNLMCTSFIEFIITALKTSLLYGILSFCIFYVFSLDFKRSIRQVYGVLSKM